MKREEETRRKREEEKKRRGESEKNVPNFVQSPPLLLSSSSLLLFLLIFAHLTIALPLAYFLNIWADEASTLYTTENGLFETFHRAFTDEKQAPLYFWLLSIWRALDGSIFFARLFSVIFSVLAIRFFYDLARRLFDAKAAFFVTAFFALHPFLIWASLEIRVYSLVILLSVLLLRFWHEAYFEREPANRLGRAEIFYVLTAIVALYTNYYLGFVLAGAFAALIVSGKWRAARRYFWQMLIVGASVVPLLLMIRAQFAASAGGFQGEKSVVEGLRLVWNYFLTFVLPTEIFPLEEISAMSLFRVWFVRLAIVAAIIWLVRKRRFADEKILAFGAIGATVAAFLLLAYFLLGEIYVSVRHAAVLFVPVILLVAAVLREIFSTPSREAAKPRRFYLIWATTAIFIGFFFAYSLAALYPNLAKRGDWGRAAEFIRANETANQPIVVFTAFDALALPYHYKGANRILPDEKHFAFDLEGDAESAEAWRRQTEFIISEIPADAREIWLLTNDKCEQGEACAPLENFVAANYTIIIEKNFYREKVRLLRKNEK